MLLPIDQGLEHGPIDFFDKLRLSGEDGLRKAALVSSSVATCGSVIGGHAIGTSQCTHEMMTGYGQ